MKANISKEISGIKRRLMAKVAKNGLYENFGTKEIDKLTEKWYRIVVLQNGNHNFYQSVEYGKIREFENWCMSYCG